MTYLSIILAAVFLSILINSLLKRAGIPTVIGYIVTGVAISMVFGLSGHYEKLNKIAEFGIVFLMFTIGLEFSFKALVAMRKEVFLLGSLQMVFSTVVISSISYLIGIDIKGSIIIGLALSLSSTAIVLKMLNETGQIQAPFGRKSLGILIFQDLSVIPILLLISIFSSSHHDIPLMLRMIIGDAVTVGIIVYVIGKYFLNGLLGWIAKSDSSEIFLATVLFLVIGSAQLAHLFGFTYSLGAFLAGMMLAKTHYKYQIEAELIPFRDILMGLFFVTVGMQIDIDTLIHNLGWILLVTTIVMGIKFGIIISFLRLFTRKRVALKTALTLSQVGEFALAIFSLTLENGLLDAKVVQILFGSVVLSMILSVFILVNVRTIADKLSPEPDIEAIVYSSGFSEHTIVCGYGPLGQNVVSRLKAIGAHYIILEHDIHRMELGKARGEPIFFANAANDEILRNFDVDRACAVIVAVGNPRHTRLICEALNKAANNPNIIVKVQSDEDKNMIDDLHIDYIVVQSEEIASRLVEEAMKCKVNS